MPTAAVKRLYKKVATVLRSERNPKIKSRLPVCINESDIRMHIGVIKSTARVFSVNKRSHRKNTKAPVNK